MKEELRIKFEETFSNRATDPVFFFSPGRVNLIGEHTDYNNGYVLPCALNYGTYLAAAPNNDNKLRLHTLNFDYSLECDIDKITRDENGEWVNYPLGIAMEFLNRGIKLRGLDMLYFGNIPNGAGLSSSASIEMVTAVAFDHFASSAIDRLEMVKLSQGAENNFVGMNCGIMDQFAVGFGEKNKALFLNCDTLEYRTVPLDLGNYQLIITNTNKRRGLTDSKYNERRSQCEEAVSIISRNRNIDHLSQLSIDDLPMVKELVTDPVIYKRAKHVITENNRVLEAVKELHSGNLNKFGELMNASHDSLKDDYDVTGVELDTLVYEARKISGVIGSRMTGAGFGGCTVSLVSKSEVKNFTEVLSDNYSQKTGLKADFYTPTIGQGATRI